MKKIDSLDKKLASLLTDDPQITTKKLAQTLGVMEKTVVNRLEILSSNNLLKVTTQWNMRALGLDVLGHLFIDIGSNSLESVVEKLAEYQHVLMVSEMSAWPRLYAFVVAEDLDALFNTVNRIVADIPGVSLVETHVAARVVKFATNYGGGESSQNWNPGFDSLTSRVDIDQFDFDLITNMQDDARISNRALARQLDASETKVRQRFKKIVDSEILRKVAVVQPFAFEYGFGCLVRIDVDGGHPEVLCNALNEEADVAMVMKLLGNYNVIALVFGENMQSVTECVHNKLASFPEVNRYNMAPITKVFKYTYGLVPF